MRRGVILPEDCTGMSYAEFGAFSVIVEWMLDQSPLPGHLPLDFRDKVFPMCSCHDKQWAELWEKRLRSRFALTPDGQWFLHPRITSSLLGKEKRKAIRRSVERPVTKILGPLASLWNEVC